MTTTQSSIRSSTREPAQPGGRRWRRRLAVAASVAVAAGGVTAIAAQGASASAVAVDTSAYYVITSVNSGKALSLAQQSATDGVDFVQNTTSGAATQQFTFLDSGDGYYRLQNRHSGKVVDVWGWSEDNGADVRQYSDHGGANQQFSVTGPDAAHVTLTNRNSGKVLDVWAKSTADGARISQYTATGGANQTWKLTKVDAGSGDGGSQDGPVGWATENGGTTGGAGGATVTVSTAADFLSAIRSSTAQTVRLTANIALSGMHKVTSNKTIIGSGSGKTITGGGLNISSQKNIIIRNLDFTGWDDDAINIQSAST
ncbi:MAG: RICIN domain-containing protein, partial [Kineosporiaceae bacterium]